MMRAHYYAAVEPDMEKAKSCIARPLEEDSIPRSFIYEENIRSYLRNSYQIFDYIGQAGLYIEYVGKFMDTESDIVDYNDALWKNLAEAYGTLRLYDKEAELYGKIARSAEEHGEQRTKPGITILYSDDAHQSGSRHGSHRLGLQGTLFLHGHGLCRCQQRDR